MVSKSEIKAAITSGHHASSVLEEVFALLSDAYSAGFFSSNCAHNGEMVDDVELRELWQTQKEYTEDMFKEWIDSKLT
jgi:hypothetical protein